MTGTRATEVKSARQEQHPSSLPAISAEQAPGGRSTATEASAVHYYSDQDLVAELGLPKEKLAEIDALVTRTRHAVMEVFSGHASVKAAGPNAVLVSVLVPSEVSKDLREKFYASLRQILDKDFDDYFIAQNATRLEAKMEFFGEFPLVYEIEGMGETLAASTAFRLQANVSRHTGTSFTFGTFSAEGLADRYGPLARLALASKR